MKWSWWRAKCGTWSWENGKWQCFRLFQIGKWTFPLQPFFILSSKTFSSQDQLGEKYVRGRNGYFFEEPLLKEMAIIISCALIWGDHHLVPCVPYCQLISRLVPNTQIQLTLPPKKKNWNWEQASSCVILIFVNMDLSMNLERTGAYCSLRAHTHSH